MIRLMTYLAPAAIVVAAALCASPGVGLAQSLNLGGTDGELPIDVYAQDGIEWQQDEEVFIARGDARAVRGGVEVLGDELRAYYRKGPGGDSEVWRLDALGNVRIVSKSETAYGSRAIYNADQKVLVIDGERPRLISGQDTLTATQQLEYWEVKRFAVARGNAVATREKRQIRADVLVAHFKNNARGDTRVHRVDAYDNVRIRTATETAVGDRGVYNVDTGLATLTGKVMIVREDNQLNGCRAEVDLNTGVSRLYACPGATGQGRVTGSFTPKNRNSN